MTNISDIATPIPEFDDEDAHGRRKALVHQCRKPWPELNQTDNDQVRFCKRCKTSVYRVTDAAGLARAVAANQCAYVDPLGGSKYLGMMSMDYFKKSALNWDE